ncbi:MAG: mercury transporter MerT [Alphaproteobacteria bacterium]|nr:mercury transporter MerT [Alphaproteobacteria bacterium]
MKNKSIWGTLIGALGSSFLASLCCIGPWLILTVGIGGTWATYIGFFEPYRPYMIVFVMLLFGYSFYKLYMKPPPCGVGAACISPKVLFIQRGIFWIIVVISIALLAFPWYSGLLFKILY